ncbi:MAG: ATP synthase F0 subunit B [Bdellovibrionota bacterium]
MDALRDIAAQLGLDQTFFYLFGLVFALHLFLSATYLKPFQKLIEHRRKKTEGVKEEAQQLMAQAEEKFNQYKSRLKEVNERARSAYRDSEEQARKEESRILGEASARAKDTLQETQKELDQQRKATVAALSGEISGMASEIATKVMGRPLGV